MVFWQNNSLSLVSTYKKVSVTIKDIRNTHHFAVKVKTKRLNKPKVRESSLHSTTFKTKCQYKTSGTVNSSLKMPRCYLVDTPAASRAILGKC